MNEKTTNTITRELTIENIVGMPPDEWIDVVLRLDLERELPSGDCPGANWTVAGWEIEKVAVKTPHRWSLIQRNAIIDNRIEEYIENSEWDDGSDEE